jgi:hypothetical protein
MSNIINKPYARCGITLVVGLDNIASKCKIAFKEANRFINSGKEPFVIILGCSAKVQPKKVGVNIIPN